MKTDISHIPESKQVEIENVIKEINNIPNRIAKVEMIILFWSYARGDFVEEDLKFYEWHYEEYRSDFDILVITKNPSEKNTKLLFEIENKIRKNREIETPVSVIVEHIWHVNARLEENRYFYLDIKREGVVLFDSKNCELKDGKKLTRQKENEIKKWDYDMWFEWWNNSLKIYTFGFKENLLNECAFNLHQATEKFLSAYLLVKTWYKPKTHDLGVLYKNLKKLDDSFSNWFNLKDENEKKYFELLKKAYVDARYSKNYKITKKELDFLEDKVLILKDIVEKLCKEIIK